MVALSLLHTPAFSYDAEESGWEAGSFTPREPWREGQVDLPAYPEQGRLLEVHAAGGGFPYDVYIDPSSLSLNKDGVVRYTVVVVSAEGALNISYEGMRCGKRIYRRYAYGVNDEWYQLGETAWEPVADSGPGHYRYRFYRNYLCDSQNPRRSVEDIINRIRSSRNSVQIEE